MHSRRTLRPLKAILLSGAALALLAACQPGSFGHSGRSAEWARARGAYSVVSASPSRAILSAQGQSVAVEPSPGFCLAEDSIETSDRSAFVLIGDCMMGDDAGMAGGGFDAPGMPGVITVSIAGDPGFATNGASPQDLSQLETYLAGPEGRTLLGRGGDGSQVSVVETRRQGDILYVLVEDRADEAVPLFGPRFWRAFVELNDRLAVVTVNGFRDVPMGDDQMLSHLGQQVRQLQMANAQPVEEAPIQFASSPRRPATADTGSGDEVPVEIEVVDAQPASGTGDAWEELQAAELPSDDEDVALGGPLTTWPDLAADGDIEDEAAAEQLGDTWTSLAGAGAADTAVVTDSAASVTAEAAKESAAPATVEEARPASAPVVIASGRAGGQGLWPMPAARPASSGAAAPAAPAMSVPARRPAEIADAAPVPAPRAVNPADSVTGTPQQSPGNVPLPPRRVRR